jgi:hypothetical protein
VVVLLEKIKIARKVQNCFVTTVNEIIVQMNAAEINGLAVRIDEEPRVAGANTQWPSGFCRHQKTRHKNKPGQNSQGKASSG